MKYCGRMNRLYPCCYYVISFVRQSKNGYLGYNRKNLLKASFTCKVFLGKNCASVKEIMIHSVKRWDCGEICHPNCMVEREVGIRKMY
jgi:hypothetical protein